MIQEGEVKYCNISKNVFLKHLEYNYSYIKEKLPLLDILDPDAIHDIRVTSRRNRALFTEFKKFLPEEIRKEYVSENKSITRLLGKRRELDVLFQLFVMVKEENPQLFPPHITELLSSFFIEEKKKEENNCLLAKQILEKRIKELDTIFQLYFPEGECVYKNGKKRILFLLDNIQKEYELIKKINDPLNEKLHKFRILLKKTRYIFEIYREIYKNPLNEWLNILKEIQTHLGTWNDYRIFLITIKKIYKEGSNINHREFSNIRNHICDIIINELIKAKSVKEKSITGKFLRLTRESISKTYKLHSCNEHNCKYKVIK